MSTKTIVAALAALTLLAVFFSTHEHTKTDAFQEWKAQYGVNWAPEEDAYRRVIFMKNLQAIEKHNADLSQTYQMGVNQFTIYSQQEFALLFLGAIPPVDQEIVESQDYFYAPSNDIDWTTKGGVSRVKNQGQCGSCWAFSTTGTLESWAMIAGKQADLSEQQLVDCTRPTNYGCQGGWPYVALQYVTKNGIASQSEYPYTAKDGACAKTGGSFKISGYNSLPGCAGLTNQLNNRPISVTVDAGNWSSYRSGVFGNCEGRINHAVLLVGSVDGAWKIKNSWGTSWGENGFIRLKGGNTCGLCNIAGVTPK